MVGAGPLNPAPAQAADGDLVLLGTTNLAAHLTVIDVGTSGAAALTCSSDAVGLFGHGATDAGVRGVSEHSVAVEGLGYADDQPGAAGLSAVFRTEASTVTASDPVFDNVTLTATTLSALVVGSLEWFQDAPNVDQIVSEAIAKAVALEPPKARRDGRPTHPA
jgi:hypothetical protein